MYKEADDVHEQILHKLVSRLTLSLFSSSNFHSPINMKEKFKHPNFMFILFRFHKFQQIQQNIYLSH